MLVLPQALLERILAHARDAAPAEACGVLGGRDEGPVRRAEVAHGCRNVARHPAWEYLAAPEDQLRAFLAVEGAGLEVVGVYHSHPRGPQGPSQADAARAGYPGLSYLIAWLQPAQGWGSWRWAPPRFEREQVQVG